MSRINNYIKNHLSLIITIFLLVQPILDLFVSLSLNVFSHSFNIGIIVRVLFLIFIVGVSIFTYKKKKNFIFLGLLFLYSILYFIANIDSGGFVELHGLFRVLYFPIVFLSLYSIKDEFKVSNMVLIVYLFTYIFLIFVANITNSGFDSYAIAKSGSIGWFNATNEISCIISIMIPIMFAVFSNKKNIILKFFLLGIFFVVISQMGTKSPFLALFITILFMIAFFVVFLLRKKLYKMFFLLIGIIVVGFTSIILIIPKTTFYKNIMIHLNYLKVDNIFEVLSDSYLFDHFIFSQRITFLENTELEYDSSDTMERFFGIGYYDDDLKVYKSIEMDYYDIYYSHGVIGFIIIIGIYLFILYKLFKSLPKKLYFSKYMEYISVILIMFLGLFSGHVMVAPSVSILCIIIIINLIGNKKKYLMFTAYDLGIGGIESSLVNMLNIIDYDKYNVSVYLEKKSGELIERVNKNVNIIEFKVSDNSNIIIRKVVNLSRRIIFSIMNYHVYDFSCCYATYSLSGSKLVRIASLNNSIYVHSDYRYVYSYDDYIKFYDDRGIDSFRRIVFVSNQSMEYFCSVYDNLKEKVLVINNFVDVDRIKRLSCEKVDIKKSNSKKLFVFVGRLDDSSKKVGRAINLVKSIDEMEFLIVGDGPDRKKYEDMVKKYKLESRVKFLGKKSNPYPYMKLADYIILTSDYEGFPVIYLEALILSVPIITTIDVSDDSFTIDDFGFVISKNESVFVEQVKNILKNKKKIDFKDINIIQEKKKKKLEKLFDGVI